ncbi:UNVERIFIED_CONTAM: hypothetical protein K2H54_056303 [Gekko kuhli]
MVKPSLFHLGNQIKVFFSSRWRRNGCGWDTDAQRGALSVGVSTGEQTDGERLPEDKSHQRKPPSGAAHWVRKPRTRAPLDIGANPLSIQGRPAPSYTSRNPGPSQPKTSTKDLRRHRKEDPQVTVLWQSSTIRLAEETAQPPEDGRRRRMEKLPPILQSSGGEDNKAVRKKAEQVAKPFRKRADQVAKPFRKRAAENNKASRKAAAKTIKAFRESTANTKAFQQRVKDGWPIHLPADPVGISR